MSEAGTSVGDRLVMDGQHTLVVRRLDGPAIRMLSPNLLRAARDESAESFQLTKEYGRRIMPCIKPEERFERIERQLAFLAGHQAELTPSIEALKEIVLHA